MGRRVNARAIVENDMPKREKSKRYPVRIIHVADAAVQTAETVFGQIRIILPVRRQTMKQRRNQTGCISAMFSKAICDVNTLGHPPANRTIARQAPDIHAS